jgi:hypothetical protein
MDGYGFLGRERLLTLLMQVSHLDPEQQHFVAEWANRVLTEVGLLENILAGFVKVADICDGQLMVGTTTRGVAALHEADLVRKIDTGKN